MVSTRLQPVTQPSVFDFIVPSEFSQPLTTKPHILVIGAGPAGLSAAVALARGGTKVTVVESSDRVGGMCGSFSLWDQIVDLGPHRFFSQDETVHRFWLSFAGEDVSKVSRFTRIYYKGKFFSYPLKPFEALSKLGPVLSTLCLLSYLKQQYFSTTRELKTFEDWVTRHFGSKLFGIFFKSYSEKLWGIPCDRIDADFAAQRIKKFSLGQAVLKAFNLTQKIHKTLVDEFFYPRNGTGQVYENMALEIERLGGKIILNQSVTGLRTDNYRVSHVELSSGEQIQADEFVSTMPLTRLVANLPNPTAPVQNALEKLKFRNTILVYLELQSCSIFPDQWIYVHSKDVAFGRITNFRNWVPSLYGVKKTSIICLEYWCNDEDFIWKESDASVEKMAKNEVQKIQAFQGIPILNSKCVRIAKSYPVYEIGYKERVKVIRDFLESYKNLQVIGRYGSFKYNNQDHSIYMGLVAAQNILTGSNDDLWSVNSDYDAYQEG